MADRASMGTWITGTIRGMATLDRCRSGARSRFSTSRAMRLGMGAGMLEMPGMMRRASIVRGMWVGVVVAVGVVAGGKA